MQNDPGTIDIDGPTADLWKHFEAAGGSDKDRMVTIASWMLAFAIGIVGYVITQKWPIAAKDGFTTGWLAALGLLVCAIAMVVIVIFGRAARRLWRLADELVTNTNFAKFAYRKPRYDPKSSHMAPIFNIFMVIDLLVAVMLITIVVKAITA